MIDLIQYEIAVQSMGLSMCVFMALFFFMDSKDKTSTKKSPRRFLSGFMLTYGTTFLDDLLIATEITSRYPSLHGVFIPAFFLLGPFLYFYVRDTCAMHSYTFARPLLKHFILFATSIIVLIPFYILPSDDKQVIFSENNISSTESLLPWFAIISISMVHVALLIQMLFYLVQSFRILMRYFENLKDFFSNVEDRRLDWLRLLIFMLSISWAVFTYESVVVWPDLMDDTARVATSTLDVAIIYFISFMGLRQVAVFRDQISSQKHQNKAKTDSNGKQKYARSALSEEDSERILSKLYHAIANEGLYSDSMLSLRGLSDHTNISSNYISQVINQKTDSHFFDYVNRFRIEAAMKKLTHDGEKNSILNIAYDVGFNSKSTFNTAFKRHTGKTPSEFRKMQIPVAD